MKTFVMMVLNTIASALIGMVLFVFTVSDLESDGDDVLDRLAVTTKKKAYDQGRRDGISDGIRQAKEEIMANLRAD